MTSAWPVVSVAVVSILQVLGVVVGGPLLVGLMRKVRCRLEGRVGPPVHQPLLDLRKLARRERTRPDQASWIFSAVPLVLVATTLVIAVVDPLAATNPAFGWSADLFALVYLLLVGSIARYSASHARAVSRKRSTWPAGVAVGISDPTKRRRWKAASPPASSASHSSNASRPSRVRV